MGFNSGFKGLRNSEISEDNFRNTMGLKSLYSRTILKAVTFHERETSKQHKYSVKFSYLIHEANMKNVRVYLFNLFIVRLWRESSQLNKSFSELVLNPFLKFQKADLIPPFRTGDTLLVIPGETEDTLL